MAGPAVVDPNRKQERLFTRETPEDTQVMIGLMQVIHSEPLASAFAKLLDNQVDASQALHLAHFFEEASVLAGRGHLAEDLLFDVFALDHYWDQLEGTVAAARKRTKNPKLCENFELLSETAREYRASRPSRS
jgi:hypothetical protein